MSNSTAMTALAELGFLRTQHIAEETSITIIPKFSSPPLHFLSCSVGPFSPNYPISVPLWLAITLRKSNRCHISPPSWLDPSSLLHHLSLEKSDPTSFQPLPYHWLETAHLLLLHAKPDLSQPDRVEELLKDVEEVRKAKVHAGLMNWRAGEPTTVKLNGVGGMEVEGVRGMAKDVLRKFWLMQQKGGEGGGEGEGRVGGSQESQESGEEERGRGMGTEGQRAGGGTGQSTERLRRYR